jgi:hypothetical protein
MFLILNAQGEAETAKAICQIVADAENEYQVSFYANNTIETAVAITKKICYCRYDAPCMACGDDFHREIPVLPTHSNVLSFCRSQNEVNSEDQVAIVSCLVSAEEILKRT